MLRTFGDGALFGDVTGDAPPRVLALHGWGRDRRDLAAVCAGFPAVALDLPGFGASPAPGTACGAEGYAALLTPVLDTLATPAVVLGHSFGGRVAVALAAARPDAVGALVLTGVPLLAPAGATARKSPLAFRTLKTLRRFGLVSEARLEAARQRYGSADYRAASGVLRDVLVTVVAETREGRYEPALRTLAERATPVEMVWGEGDTAAPVEMAERAAALLGPAAHLTVVPGAGPDTVHTAVDALRDALGRALAAVPG